MYKELFDKFLDTIDGLTDVEIEKLSFDILSNMDYAMEKTASRALDAKKAISGVYKKVKKASKKSSKKIKDARFVLDQADALKRHFKTKPADAWRAGGYSKVQLKQSRQMAAAKQKLREASRKRRVAIGAVAAGGTGVAAGVVGGKNKSKD